MTHIAFFGHDAADAAIERRIAAMQQDAMTVTGFMMRRDEAKERKWNNIDLGRTYDADFKQRLKAMKVGMKTALRHEDILRKAKVLYARNLDMLYVADKVRAKLNLKTPLIYECLDIHHALIGNGLRARGLRGFEKHLIQRSSLLVYSSPAFERDYFRNHYKDQYTPYLLENKLVDNENLPIRPNICQKSDTLTLGWVGILRCQRSLNLLCALTDQFDGRVKVALHGKPALTVIPEFHKKIEQHEHISFAGAYKAPQDLRRIYEEFDLVWAGDWYQESFNSPRLLPNRIYEGGYFCVPAIAPKKTETANWLEMHQVGFTLDDVIENTLPEFIGKVLNNRGMISKAQQALDALSRDIFVEPKGEMRDLINIAMDEAG